MNRYYVRFEIEHMTVSGIPTTDMAEEVVYAHDESHIERLLSRHYNLANIYDDDIPNLDLAIILNDDTNRKRGGIASFWERRAVLRSTAIARIKKRNT